MPNMLPFQNQLARGFRLAALGAVLTIAACSDEDGDAVDSAALTTAATIVLDAQDLTVAQMADVSSAITLSGPLQPKEQVTLRAQVPGTVADLRVDRGSNVVRGQRLATIRAAGLQSQAAGARAGVAAAQANLAVARQRLVGRGVRFGTNGRHPVDRLAHVLGIAADHPGQRPADDDQALSRTLSWILKENGYEVSEIDEKELDAFLARTERLKDAARITPGAYTAPFWERWRDRWNAFVATASAWTTLVWIAWIRTTWSEFAAARSSAVAARAYCLA